MPNRFVNLLNRKYKPIKYNFLKTNKIKQLYNNNLDCYNN